MDAVKCTLGVAQAVEQGTYPVDAGAYAETPAGVEFLQHAGQGHFRQQDGAAF